MQYVDRKTGFSVVGQAAELRWQHAAVLHTSPKGGGQRRAVDETNAMLLQGSTEGRVLVEP